jgi:hypothetical protein
MSKTFKNSIVTLIKKLILKRKDVKIYNNTVFSGCDFLGKAIIEPYCRLSGDPQNNNR